MAITKGNLIDRAAQIASTIGGQTIPVNEATVELLLPLVMRFVLRDGNLSREKLFTLRQTVELNFLENEAEIDDLILVEYLDSATLNDENNSRNFSFVPTKYDLSDYLPDVFDYWTVEDDTVTVKIQGTASFSGTLLLTCVSMPEIPVNPTEEIDITENLADDIVAELARAIRGEKPYANLVGDNQKL